MPRICDLKFAEFDLPNTFLRKLKSKNLTDPAYIQIGTKKASLSKILSVIITWIVLPKR